jgi:hypothetical protein
MKTKALILSALMVLQAPAITAQRMEEKIVIDFSAITADTSVQGRKYHSLTAARVTAGTKDQLASLLPEEWTAALPPWVWDDPLGPPKAELSPLSSSSYTVPYDEREYAGQSVMRIAGKINSDRPAVRISPPFSIPAEEDATILSPAGKITPISERRGKRDKYEGLGVVKNVGVLHSCSVSLCNLKAPVYFTVLLENEDGTFLSVPLGKIEPGRTWATYIFAFPTFAAYSRYAGTVRFSYFRISGFIIESAAFNERIGALYTRMRSMTEEQKLLAEEEFAALPLEEEEIEVLVKSVQIISGLR